MVKTSELREKKIGTLLWNFSLPAIVGMLINSLYNVVDRIFVGRGIGSVGIAATTVAFPIMIVLMAVSILIGVGATALISIRLGERKQEEAEMIAGNAMALLVILPAAVAAIFLIFAEPILVLFGASPEVLPYAKDFVQIIMLGSAFGSLSLGMNNFIRAEGNPKIAMYTQILGGVMNVLLNYLFIFVFSWGMKGSALATITAQLISALWVLGYFFTGKSLVKIRLKNLKPRMHVFAGIVSIGFAPFAIQIAASIQQMILNKTLTTYGGDMALSAIGIIMSLATLFFMPVIGVSQGAQPIIGFNYGARQFDRVKEALKTAVIASACIALAAWLVLHIWPTQLVGLFSDGDVALTRMTVHALLIYFMLMPLAAVQIICSNYFQAVNKAVLSAVLSLSRQVLMFIPLLLILPHFWGVEGVWRTAPIADVLSVILTGGLIYMELKNLDRDHEKEKTEKSVPDNGILGNSKYEPQEHCCNAK